MSRILHVPDVPLYGQQMIEASAGTGKTWTIAALYLRLLLERALPVEKILVVTYTNAATAELKERIRQRLLAAYRECVQSDAQGIRDVVLAEVLKVVPGDKARVLLTLALESFDLASIHTIHGFCQRALAERAFESGLAFDAELASDDRRVLHEAVEDFWRKEVSASTDSEWLGWLLTHLPGPDVLLRSLSPHFAKPYLLHVTAPAWDKTASAAFASAAQKVRELWHRDGEAAMTLLRTHGNLHKANYAPDKLAKLEAELSPWLDAVNRAALPPENLARLGTATLTAKTTSKATPPNHPLFDAVDECLTTAKALEAANQARLGELLQRALLQCEANLHEARQRASTRSFDDLLLDLHVALQSERGDALAQSLRQRYGVALIDEFQDTDPLQYDIFNRVFGAGNRSSPSEAKAGLCLFFVGDPKQAIYSFRGADLRAYLQARQSVGEPLMLDTNRRSTPALVAAVNTLFARRERPFLDDELQFEPVKASPTPPPALTMDGEVLPAMDVWFVPRTASEAEPRKSGTYKGLPKSIAKNRATPLIVEAVAARVVSLLNAGQRGTALIGERPVEGQDIAILVKSHHQGEQMRAALQAVGVASVRYGQDSIYNTQEALEVERVLLAIAHPGREGLVRGALATSLMGVRGDELAMLDGAAWLSHLDAFHHWHAAARDGGFIRMWRLWQYEANVPSRLLALPDGERRMTNLLHVSDMLATLAHDDDLGVEALAKHLADARNDARGESDTGEGRLLRLESDENLVRIVTIHTSKGLEYPITFCPFLWDGGMRDAVSPVRYHDVAHDHQAALDFGSAEQAEHIAVAEQEVRAEALRLAYVALTRAKQHCVLVWGAMTDADKSPLAWLLQGVAPEQFGALNDSDLLQSLAVFKAECDAVVIRDLPAADGVMYRNLHDESAELIARSYPSRAFWPWRMHSFTSWALTEQSTGQDTAQAHTEHASAAEQPDHDALAQTQVVGLVEGESAAQNSLFKVSDFPRGADAGTCLHAMFERVDFAALASNESAGTIQDALSEFGFAPDLQASATRLISDVLHTPLSNELPALKDIPLKQQIREMEFMLPLSAPDMKALAAAVGEKQGADGRLAERILTLQPPQLSGFLKGFIDLVFAHEDRFYILDYKSNYLGAQLESYAQPALVTAMADSMYDLQLLLYAVALHRGLQQRLPDYDYNRHCGGGLYLFLRGMQQNVAGSGVLAWRPSREVIERVDAMLQATKRVLAC